MNYSSVTIRGLLLVFLFLSGCGSDTHIWSAESRPPYQGDPQIVEALTPLLIKHQLPALGGAILDGSGDLRVGVVGIRKAGQGVPVTENDLWHLGSCAKAMHATLAAKLVEQGKLRWDITLAEAFPDLAGSFKPDFAAITIAQLLQHRSGLARDGDYRRLSRSGTIQEQRRQALIVAASAELLHQPGEKYLYSNLGYIVAGAIIERVTGRAYEELMREMLFEPMGMASARFETPDTLKLDHVASSHFEDGRCVPPDHAILSDPAVMRPAGGIRMTLNDWSKFIRHHLIGESGRSDYLSSDSFKSLHTPPDGFEYALGWVVVNRDWAGGRTLNHTGSNTLNFANVWIAPDKDFAIFVCTNRSSFDATDEAIASLIPLASNPAQSK